MFGPDGKPRLVHQLADTDENDGLRRFWPSSKIARKFVELHAAANRGGTCTQSGRVTSEEPITDGASIATLASRISDTFRQLDLKNIAIDQRAFDDLDDVRKDLVTAAELLRTIKTNDAIANLETLDSLYQLQRDLDFFWFGLETLARASDDTEKKQIEQLQQGYTNLTKLMSSVKATVATQLVQALAKCNGSIQQ